MGLASKIFNRPSDMAIAEELTQGCIWAYDSSPNGIMPEIFGAMPCPKYENCNWSEEIWQDAINENYPTPSTTNDEDKKTHVQKVITEMRLPKGFTTVDDRRYILRPEAIESVFLMYRMTGKQVYAEAAWRMFQAIEKVSRTSIAAAAIIDITQPPGGSVKDDENEVGIGQRRGAADRRHRAGDGRRGRINGLIDLGIADRDHGGIQHDLLFQVAQDDVEATLGEHGGLGLVHAGIGHRALDQRTTQKNRDDAGEKEQEGEHDKQRRAAAVGIARISFGAGRVHGRKEVEASPFGDQQAGKFNRD